MENQIRWTDFIPLLAAYFAKIAKLSTTYAFYIGATLAVMQMAYMWYRGQHVDYIALGANTYLIYGALGYAISETLLLPPVITKQGSIFAWIFITGLIITVVTKEGFLQLPESSQEQSLFGSLSLLAATGLTFLISYCLVTYAGFSTASGVMWPLGILVTARVLLRNYFMKVS